ncbi:BtpA/SgcQ family protein [Archaeoglobus neptunius]|uniref:BtpA/SgcQ family protein n=1 Tax=Archaeoglobus neptunius TaxID=2798580 RepID=UPI001928BB4D|nr:BtpA/SgcQ family protein [Archaeoglobus neptunius]
MEKAVIGVVHLLPLPGSPEFTDLEEVIEKALIDARAVEEGGADALILENYGDKPFVKEVGKEVVAAMSAIACEVKKDVSIGLGINVLRNDAVAALAVAKAVNADFVRVNQLFFSSISPEGILEGDCGGIMRYKRMIDCRAMIFADVAVKHAVHTVPLEDYCINAERSLADALIVTGKATGREIDLNDLKLVKESVKMPVLAGSGVNAENASRILRFCDGVIVGSYIKNGGRVDADRVSKIVRIAKG